MRRLDWTSVGARIRKQRETLGYTREAFAEKLDVTPKFCSDIELGVKGMSVTTLCRIAAALSLSTDYILFGDTPEVSPLEAMVSQCPADKAEQLQTIIHAYLNAVQ